MRSQRSIVRKATKARARRKDFRRRANINLNVPTTVREEKHELFSSKHIRGQALPELKHVGNKTILVKEKNYRFKDPSDASRPLHDSLNREIGMIAYPMRRKFHLPKQKVTA